MFSAVLAVMIGVQPPASLKATGQRKTRPPEPVLKTSATDHPVRCTVTSASAVTLTPFRDGKEGKPQEFLQLTMRVENLHATQDLSYFSWSKMSPRYRTAPTSLETNGGGIANPAVLGFGIGPKGQRTEEVIPPLKSITDVLVFEMPSTSVQFATLTLNPGHVYIGTGEAMSAFAMAPLKIRIPATMWLKTMKPASQDSGGSKPPAEPITATDRGLKITITKADIEPALAETAVHEKETGETFLVVRLELHNAAEAAAVEFKGWGTRDFHASATTDEGDRLAMFDPGFGHRLKGETRNTLIRAGAKVSTVIAFKKPPRTAKHVTLSLPSSGFQISGDEQVFGEPITLDIPASMWSDGFKREDEARNKAIKKATGKS